MWPRATVGGFSPTHLDLAKLPTRRGLLDQGGFQQGPLPFVPSLRMMWRLGLRQCSSGELQTQGQCVPRFGSLPHPTSLWEDFAWKLRLGDSM